MKKSVINSTPIRRPCNRKSIGLIRTNTVSTMVGLFDQQKKLPTTMEANGDPVVDGSPIVDRISYFNELSAINHSPEFGSDLNNDSGYDSKSRQRSKTFGSSSVNLQRVIESYEKYPNFKWSQLKYFGVDRNEFFAGLNIDSNAKGKLSAYYSTTTNLNNNNTNGNVHSNKRKRSQSFSVKPKLKQETIVKLHLDSMDPNTTGSSKDPKMSPLLYCDRLTGVNELKLRIQQSIDSYESHLTVRRSPV